MRAILHRFADSPFGVFSYLDVLTDDGQQRVLRLCAAEDDWLDNRPGVSAIPAGQYLCRRSAWRKTGTPTFEITGVRNRSRILFHWGNTEEDVEGCVLLGSDFGALVVQDEDALPDAPKRTKWAVTGSKAAFEQFMAVLAGVETFPLYVRWAQPGAWRAA